MLTSKFYLFGLDKFAPYIEVTGGYTPYLYGYSATQQIGLEFRGDSGFTAQVSGGIGQNYDVYEAAAYGFGAGGLNLGWSY
jgi:hypothetical protein